MDQINQAWQELLIERGFAMTVAEESDHFLYQGKFALTDVHLIDFAVSLSKSDSKSLGQIVFHKVAYAKGKEERSSWLDYLNQVNQHQSIYYYFVLGDDDYVFMRYMTEVTLHNLQEFFNILLQGPTLIKNLMPLMEDHFGPFIVL